ncbi:MAG: M2 family metallopeptidase [Phycisphaerae bacterium]
MSDSQPTGLSRRTLIKSAAAATAAAALPQLTGCSDAVGPVAETSTTRDQAADFLRRYERGYQPIYTRASAADWISSTDVSDAHTKTAAEAHLEMYRFVGDPARMNEIERLRAARWQLEPAVARQLERARLMAAQAPGTVPQLVQERADAEAQQAATMNGFVYHMQQPGAAERVVKANDLDEILEKSKNLDKRLAAWNTSKLIGQPLRAGLTRLQRLRNAVARDQKFSGFFGLGAADYGMSATELMSLRRTVLDQTRPLYEQLHCYTKHKLAQRYGQPAPRRIPAHWLPNRWGQEWPGIEEAVDLDPLFAGKTREWIVTQAEQFYVSMGFPKLPVSFWPRSDLYEVPPGGKRLKNSHASAWHIDLDHDVRSLMSVKPNAQWFFTAHHELGHIYYFLSYSRPSVPLLFRDGANPAFHEAIGELISLASRQPAYLAEIGLLKSKPSDSTRWLLAQALDGSNIVFQPFSWGTMGGFEHDLYESDLPPDRYNSRWWELVAECQGIDPPAPRGEEFCDAASKTHINDDPGGYYKYGMCSLIVYQLHDYISRKILKADPHDCNYYGNKKVGEYLYALLSLGASRDWRSVLRDFTGEDLSARAMMEFYAPLNDFLKKENAGKDAAFA